MFIASFPVSAWQSNCYVVAAEQSGPCVVIDPGPGAADGIREVLAQLPELRVAAVVATHGHVDHVADAAAVCAANDVPLWIHPSDRPLLTDAEAGIGPGSREWIEGLLGHALDMVEPADVRDLPDDGTIAVAGLEVRCRVAPGHTRGCTLLLLDYPDRDDVDQVCFSGDVLFAGSIGRTDLATGDPAAMEATLRDVVAPLSPATVVLPGHGPQTTMARELATNPYLREESALSVSRGSGISEQPPS